MLNVCPVLDEVVVIGGPSFKETQLVAVPLVLDLEVYAKLDIQLG